MRERVEKQSIGEQLARFSLYVPLVVMVLGFCTTGITERERDVGIALFYFNVALIVSGFLAGIAALISISRFGRSGILYRALGGIILNGIVIVATFAFLLPVIRTAQMREAIVGHWTLTQGPTLAAKVEVQLEKDGRFRFTADDGTNPVATIAGRWAFTRDHLLGFSVEEITNGNPEMTGKKIGVGTVLSADKAQMVLKTDKGNETYRKR